MSLLLTTSRADTRNEQKEIDVRLLDYQIFSSLLASNRCLQVWTSSIRDNLQFRIDQIDTRPVPIDENAPDVLLGYFVFGARALFRKRDDIIELQLTLAGRNNLYRSGCSLILYILCLPGRLKLSIRYRVICFIIV